MPRVRMYRHLSSARGRGGLSLTKRRVCIPRRRPMGGRSYQSYVSELRGRTMTVDPTDLTDEELVSAISQLQSEVVMPGPSPINKLNRCKNEADERGLMW